MKFRQEMRRRWKRTLALVASVLIAVVWGGVVLWQSPECEVCEAANQILLLGTVAHNCTVDVTPNPNATNLPLTTPGSQHVLVGTALQNCNKKAGYTLVVSSMNCATTPAGGKVIDSVSGDYLKYSTEFINPTTGGSSPDVSGLLASACTNQNARDVINAKITGETSSVYINFTGTPGLTAATYQDTLIITMNIK